MFVVCLTCGTCRRCSRTTRCRRAAFRVKPRVTNFGRRPWARLLEQTPNMAWSDSMTVSMYALRPRSSRQGCDRSSGATCLRAGWCTSTVRSDDDDPTAPTPDATMQSGPCAGDRHSACTTSETVFQKSLRRVSDGACVAQATAVATDKARTRTSREGNLLHDRLLSVK